MRAHPVRVSKKRVASLIVCVVTGLFAATGLQAAPITVPVGLNPGDTYRLAFVTSTTRDATSSDIADYNAFVTAAAISVPELAALGTTWRAIASTASVDARDNTNTNPLSDIGGAIYSLDGVDLIAADNADLWDGSLVTPLRESENGIIENQIEKTWTGTWVDGQGLAGATLGESFISVGFANFPTTPWIAAEGQTPEQLLHFYAISDVLTVGAVEVPVPASLWILLPGLVLLRSIHRRRIRPAG